jgi:glycosyltransferase involved in cell wall biosynthesis
MFLPVRRIDVLAADLSQPFQPPVRLAMPGQPVLVNWVTTPPSAGSGGHTTLFRIVRYLEAHGFLNRIYFYDVYRGDHSYYESIVRKYYGFHGPVARVEEGMADAHAVFATSWQTAYPVFNSRCTGKRFYFVQDFEPSFYPVGSFSFLAENTYRMGFHAVTAGRWLAQKLSTEFGMCADPFEFGCDTSHYQRFENSKRSGVVFYARREASRRAVELGLMALEILAARHPDIHLHLYGEKMGTLPFRYTDHGRIAPSKLNEIYNQCYAGLSLSMTNTSLVPHEMLAAGCIPVVNDALHNRIVLDNSFVRYTSPYPQALASELEALVTNSDFETLSREAASSVRHSAWDDAGAAVEATLRRALLANLHARSA